MASRQVSIYINGQQVANQIKSITSEKQKLVRELARMVVGSEEYENHIKEIGKLDGIITTHKNKLRGIEDSWKTVTAGATKFLGVTGIAFGAAEIINYGKQLYNTGVQMDTLARKASTVLGDSLGMVEAKAREVAAAMGLTNEEYVAAIANSADLLKPMGFTTEEAAKQSIQIQDLAGALSEWSGGKFNAIETTESLRKALLGEREELERYGVSIKQSEVNYALAAKGLDKLTGNSLKQAEAMVTLELITNKSADAIKGYADNSDSAIRRQAELEAKVKNISQAIATLLLPVFEKLASIAGNVVDVTQGIVDGMESLVDPAKSLTKEFDDQASKVENLEQNIAPLLDRYDELSAKTNPSKQEQKELKDIIVKVSEAIPSAVSAFGKYGEAIGLNTDAARDFIEVEKLRLKFINQDAIAAIQNQIKTLETLRDTQLALRKSGGQAAVSGSGLTGSFKPFSDDELRAFDKQIANITDKVAGANAELARLRGDNINLPNKSVTPDKPDLEFDQTEAQKAREKELKEQQANSKKLLEEIAKFKEEERRLTLSENERRLAEVAAKYQDEIDQAIELEKSKNKAVATAATEQKKELLKLQSEALAAEREKIAQDELSALTDQWLAEQEAKMEIDEKITKDQQKIYEDLKGLSDELFDARTEEELAKTQKKYDDLLELARAYGINVEQIEADTDKKRKEAAENLKIALLQQEDALFQAQKDIQLAKLNFLTTVADQIGAIAGDNAAIQEAVFIFQKTAAVAGIIIELQKQIAAIRTQWAVTRAQLAFTVAGQALIPGTYAIQTAQTSAARVGAATGIAAVVGSTIAHFVAKKKQKKEGGWADVEGSDDGQLYHAKLIGQPSTGMLDYPHPVLTSSGILANEIGKEYYVSHSDLRNPKVLDHVRAIDNITQHRQRAEGGFASTSPAANTSAPAGYDFSGLERMVALNNALLTKLLVEGVRADIGNDELLALQRQAEKLRKASGGRLG